MRFFAACAVIAHIVAGTLATTVNVDLYFVQGGSSENIEIFVGDSVNWRNGTENPVDVQSVTEEWKSPLLHPQDLYSHKFEKAGLYIYRIENFAGEPPTPLWTNVASVIVRPLVGLHPAVSIISPPDQFVVNFAPYTEAVISESGQLIATVNFFRDGEFVAAVTNAPYAIQVPATPGAHRVWVESVEANGHTNTSPPIVLNYTMGQNRSFSPSYVPNVGFVFNFVTSNGSKARVFSSDDLKTWSENDDVLKGQALIVNPRTNFSNAVFFYARGGPL